MACGADMARGTRADAMQHARPREPTRCAGGAQVALTRGRATDNMHL